MSNSSTDFRLKKEAKWLNLFQQATPVEQIQLLQEVLAAPLFLQPETLASISVYVGQLLWVHNQRQLLNKILSQLSQSLPQVWEQVSAAFSIPLFYETLYQQKWPKLKLLLQNCIAHFDVLNLQQWLLLFDNLHLYGQVEQGIELAIKLKKLAYNLAQDDREVLQETVTHHLLNGTFERWLGSPHKAKDQQKFIDDLKQAGFTKKTDVAFYLQEISRSPQSLKSTFQQALQCSDMDTVLFDGHLAFGQEVLDKYGIPMLSSLAIMQEVVAIWELFPPGTPSKERLNLSQQHIMDYAEDALDLENPDNPMPFVLAWGLPLVYDWLQQNKWVTPERYRHILKWCRSLQKQLMSQYQHVLWRFIFVFRWPCPTGVESTDLARQKKAFEASRESSLPIKHTVSLAERQLEMKKLAESIQNMTALELVYLLDRARQEFGPAVLNELLEQLLPLLPPGPGKPPEPQAKRQPKP